MFIILRPAPANRTARVSRQNEFLKSAARISDWRADAHGIQSWVVQAGLLHAPINESLDSHGVIISHDRHRRDGM
jgi:hypothetical protein